MRRRHNIVLGTVLIIVIVLLFARSQGDVLDVSGFRRPQASSYIEEKVEKLPKQTSPSVPDGQSLSLPADLVASDGPLPDTLTASGGSEQQSIPSSTELLATDQAPKVPQPGIPASSAEPQSDNPAFEVEYPFQGDLDLDFPDSILKDLSNHKPHNFDPNGPKTYAYATFMATRNPSIKDPYFLAIHSLIYRILWSPRSHTERYPLVVFVADFVTPEQRALLAGAGAVVRELSPLEWNPNVPGVPKRWKDLFAKLNMWKETEFHRILFLDADAFPLTNIDAMFDLVPLQECKAEKLQLDDFHADGSLVCEPYIFAGVPQDPIPSPNSEINVGSVVFTPSTRMHARLLQNYVKTDRYDCLMAEQAFLNWQFSPEGAFPATQLERKWGGAFPQEGEEGALKVVHEKLWAAEGGWMKREWEEQWAAMVQFYGSQEFLEARRRDGADPGN
ncbi:Nn.00g005800.m01.CDS01 [Neocucurbitaria sp. VM-36]